MYCIKCGKQLDDGTKFCIFCGADQKVASGTVSLDEPVVPKTTVLNTDTEKTVRDDGGYIPPSYGQTEGTRDLYEDFPKATHESPDSNPFTYDPPAYEPPYDPELEAPKKSSAKSIVLIVIASVLILALLALNAYQYFVLSADTKDELNNSEKELKSVSADLEELEAEYAALEESYDELGIAAQMYEDLYEYAAYNDIGYASSHFYAHSSVIVMDTDDYSYFTITCSYSSDVTVYIQDIDGNDIIDASFDGDWNGDDTDIRVESYDETGVALITFTNNLNNDTFSVIVIVQ